MSDTQVLTSEIKRSNMLFIKNIMDRSAAALALILLSPLFLILYALIKRDGGDVFYGQIRIGRNGRPFKCWKFRSMVVDAGKKLQQLLENDPVARAEWEATFKLKNDPRITRVGRFLRKTSLDELPQLYNVLRGEMSLVGPRPIVEDEKKYYGDRLGHYLSVSPGITGLWQISGRNDTTYEERVALDCAYVQNWSLKTDIVILLKTLNVLLTRKGAY